VLLGATFALAGALPAAGLADAAPTISVVTTGTAGDNGWFVTSVTVKFVLTGETSSSGCDTVTLTAEGVNSSLSCTAIGSGGSATSKPIIKIDKTPPSVSGSTDRAPNGNGWFNSPVTVSFRGTDSTSGVASCTQPTYGGPDSADATVNGTCRDAAGNVGSGAQTLRYDATAPSVSGAPQRGPDANGWYNHSVPVAFNGSDATSGVESCSSATYAGPDNEAANVAGSCTDRAGNTGQGAYALKYDGSPPRLTGLSVKTGNRQAVVHWTASPDTTAVTVTRLAAKKGARAKVVYRGKGNAVSDQKLTNGLRYRYTVYGVDQAGNVATASTVAVPRALSSPADGARLRAPPVLRWTAFAGASYYNVQLFRGRQKILSTWPAATSLKLQRTWTYGGKSYRLVPGRYAWYVWPGLGRRSATRYGKLLGGSVFYIRR
jgi:hypothetical protein